jgi:hypothetical protein
MAAQLALEHGCAERSMEEMVDGVVVPAFEGRQEHVVSPHREFVKQQAESRPLPWRAAPVDLRKEGFDPCYDVLDHRPQQVGEELAKRARSHRYIDIGPP